MEQQGIDKNETIKKMKTGSGIISIVCILSALFYVVAATAQFKSMTESYCNHEMKQMLVKAIFSHGMNAFVMLLTSAVFFRISRNGCPFIPSNILIVRAIGTLLILSGVLCAVIPAVFTGEAKMLIGMINPTGIASGMLVIFISYIMHYAALLQVESDETL